MLCADAGSSQSSSSPSVPLAPPSAFAAKTWAEWRAKLRPTANPRVHFPGAKSSVALPGARDRHQFRLFHLGWAEVETDTLAKVNGMLASLIASQLDPRPSPASHEQVEAWMVAVMWERGLAVMCRSGAGAPYSCCCNGRNPGRATPDLGSGWSVFWVPVGRSPMRAGGLRGERAYPPFLDVSRVRSYGSCSR